jgi:hypothetical protein
MPTDSYHKNYSSISKTMLSTFIRSPYEYYRYYVKQDLSPPGPKKQMLIGSAAHAILLEKMMFTEVVAVYGHECFKRDSKTKEIINSLNPKTAAEFREANSDKICLKPDECEHVFNIVEAVRNHELGQLISDPQAKFEQEIYWKCEETGLQCRCCPDFHIDMGDHVLCYDLKVTEQIYPNLFNKVANRFGYWLQEQHYGAGLIAHYGKPVVFKFWAVEAGGFLRVVPYEYDTPSRENARTAYLSAMDRLARSYADDLWTDAWTSKVQFLTLSPWDLAMQDDEELEFDDDSDATE